MILVCFGGLGGSRRAILGPMLGDVGCKMGPRWVQEGFESDFFAQLGVLMGILAPRVASKMVSGGKMSGKLEWGPAADLPVWGGVRSARTLVRIVLAMALSRLAAILWMARRI